MLFDTLIEFYLSEFQRKGEPYLKIIANCVVPSRVVRMKYKELPPIETLDVYQKKELWEFANEVFPDETKDFKIRFCEITYTIGTLL